MFYAIPTTTTRPLQTFSGCVRNTGKNKQKKAQKKHCGVHSAFSIIGYFSKLRRAVSLDPFKWNSMASPALSRSPIRIEGADEILDLIRKLHSQ
jgi:hypothetical protein